MILIFKVTSLTNRKEKTLTQHFYKKYKPFEGDPARNGFSTSDAVGRMSCPGSKNKAPRTVI